MSEPLDPIFVVDFSCFSFFSQPCRARSRDLIDFAGWQRQATNLNSPFTYLLESNFREVFCIAHGVAKSRTRLSDFHFFYSRHWYSLPTVCSCFTCGNRTPDLSDEYGSAGWRLHSPAFLAAGWDHMLQFWRKTFILLGAFLKRGTECPFPPFPLSLPLSTKGGRWPRNDHGEHSMTYCNCPGKRRLTSSTRVVRGWMRRGGILVILEEELVDSLITWGREGWRMNLRYCSWHPVDAHSQARRHRRACRLWWEVGMGVETRTSALVRMSLPRLAYVPTGSQTANWIHKSRAQGRDQVCLWGMKTSFKPWYLVRS